MAKTKEQLAWDTFSKYAEGILKMDRVENQCREAMADVNGINRTGFEFWLELKALHEWPKRATTCPLKGAFERGQVSWALSRNAWGGHCFILLRVGHEFLLFNPWREIEEATEEVLRRRAMRVGSAKEIVEHLEIMRNYSEE